MKKLTMKAVPFRTAPQCGPMVPVASSRVSRRYTAPCKPLQQHRLQQCRGGHGHSPNQGPGEQAAAIYLRIPYHVDFGQCLAIVGEGEHLGNWNPDSAIKMTWTEGDYWVAELEVKTLADTELEYKYLVLNSDGQLGLWKPGSNIKLDIPPGARIKVVENWVDGPRHVEVDLRCLRHSHHCVSEQLQVQGSAKSAIQQQTDTAMNELEFALEQQYTNVENSKDPAATDLINGDRILAAASNKAMAFNRASKAAEILPQLPGSQDTNQQRLNP